MPVGVFGRPSGGSGLMDPPGLPGPRGPKGHDGTNTHRSYKFV